MFVISGILAVGQLAAAYACYGWLARLERATAIGCTLAVGFLSFAVNALLFGSPLLALQLLVLAPLAIMLFLFKATPQRFLGCSILASLGVVAVFGVTGQKRWADLRDDHPFESIASRLTYERRAKSLRRHQPTSFQTATGQTIRDDAKARRLAWEAAPGEVTWRNRERRRALRLIHASQFEQFVNSEGFGIGRGLGPSVWAIRLPEQRPIPFEEFSGRFDGKNPDPGEKVSTSSVPIVESLTPLHWQAATQFTNPDGYGYVKSRNQVAGFQSHGFGREPDLTEAKIASVHWITVKVELVSLLKHDLPKVYVSPNLPNMAELRDVPVRNLDAFESAALEKLVQGEDIFTESRTNQIRMLGAIPAADQCLQCHSVERGTLLGAFSYVLRRDPPLWNARGLPNGI